MGGDGDDGVEGSAGVIVGGDLREVLESDVLTCEGSCGKQVLELAGGESEEGKHDWLLLFSE